MAFQQQKFPPVRLSDIDDLIRENALDSSDGLRLIEYIQRKQGAVRPRPNLLLDGADNPINFRFDNLQPVPPQPQSSTDAARTITDAADGSRAVETASPASPGIALVQPHSINNRVASFVTPVKGTPASPLGNPHSKKDAPGSRLLSPSRIPLQRSSSHGNLNRQTLIKECQRANKLKCEILRKMTSSTPNAGEKTQTSDDYFMTSKETISPIFDERSADGRSVAQARFDAVPSRLDVTVPATQEQYGAAGRNARETTPPPANEAMIVIPETPSPVRRSPSRPATPFSALQSPSMGRIVEKLRLSCKPNPHQRVSSVGSTPQKSILKRRFTNLTAEQMEVRPSPRLRVSFCDTANEVREVSPAYVRSPCSSDVTSDESSEEEVGEVHPRREEQRQSTRHSTKSDGSENRKSTNTMARPNPFAIGSSLLTRSNAIDLPVESSQPLRTGEPTTTQLDRVEQQMADVHGSKGPESPSRNLRRRTLSYSDIIWNGVAPVVSSRRLTVDRIDGEDGGSDRENGDVEQNVRQSAAGMPSPTVSRKSAIEGKSKKKNRTNSNLVDMLNEDWDGSDSGDDSRADERSPAVPAAKAVQSSTITSPMAITNIETPRSVMIEIFEPPSAFCDDVTTGADSLPMETDRPDGEERVADGCADRNDELHMRKQTVPRKRLSSSSSPTVSEAEADEQHDVPKKRDAYEQRVKSSSTPTDHVSSRLVKLVDMIHSQASVCDDAANAAEDDRRTTIVVPQKRRRAKSTVDGATERYFKTVEQVCDPKKKHAKQRGGGPERRKLFARELSEAGAIPEDNVPSPEPLPMTQDDEEGQVARETEPPAMTEEEQEVNRVDPAPVPETRSLAVVVQRLSIAAGKGMGWRNKQQEDDGRLHRDNEAPASAPKSPVVEKQNSEATEKTATTPPAKGVGEGPKRERPKKKDLKEKPKHAQKYWKDVSNELRQQIEGEGIRRSNRNRCISAQALWCNPGANKYDAPKYKLPTTKDVLRLLMESEEAQHKAQRERQAKTTKKAKTNKGKSQPRSRKPPDQAALDADGFRIPAVPPAPTVPAPAVPAPAVPAPAANGTKIRRNVAWSTSQDDDNGQHSSTNAVSSDSGLCSAVMTNDDVTETLPAPRQQKQQQQQQQQQQKVPQPQQQDQQPQPSCSGTATLPPPAGGTATRINGPGEDVVSAKRQAMDWMMKLMENQHEKQGGGSMMAADIHGFTHCSIDHLTFQRKGDIEYSFYVYSKTDNFGFVRFLPKAVKKMARVTRCSLKFLIMSGSLTFAINGHDVHAVGGDFLMLSNGSSYKIINSSEVSLLFMIKTIMDTPR